MLGSVRHSDRSVIVRLSLRKSNTTHANSPLLCKPTERYKNSCKQGGGGGASASMSFANPFIYHRGQYKAESPDQFSGLCCCCYFLESLDPDHSVVHPVLSKGCKILPGKEEGPPPMATGPSVSQPGTHSPQPRCRGTVLFGRRQFRAVHMSARIEFKLRERYIRKMHRQG